MSFNKSKFKEINYNNKSIYFKEDLYFQFHNLFGHKRKTKKFLFHKTLLDFLEENSQASIYFTLDKSIHNFKKYDDDFLINIESYIKFCKSLQSNTKGRARAFLGQYLRAKDILFTENEKLLFLKENVSEANLIALIKNLDKDSQRRIIGALGNVQKENKGTAAEMTIDGFIDAFSTFLIDEKVQLAFFQKFPQVQIETLKAQKAFVEKNLDKNETFFQDWIDEEDGKYRKQRCLIFGIEYVDPKREGKLNEKRFDILAEQNRENHVLIELKSPNADIFSVKKTQNINGGISTEYEISPELARAIPQILGYKKWYEDASPEEIQALGIESKKTVSKCIIVIGHTVEDAVWKGNFNRIKDTINIEILTYDNLIDKLENSIKNLEENL